jgi:hypothetical protein
MEPDQVSNKIGYLVWFNGSAYAPVEGKIGPMTREEVDAHNERISAADLKAIDALPIGGAWLGYYKNTEVTTFTGAVIGRVTRETDRYVYFERSGRTFRAGKKNWGDQTLIRFRRMT